MDKCEDEGQGVNQRLTSPTDSISLVAKWEAVPAPALYESEKSPDQIYWRSFQMTEKKLYQMEHTFAGSKNFFFPLSFLWLPFPNYLICSKVTSQLDPEPVTEGSWRSPDHSLCLLNWDAPSLPQHRWPHPKCPGQARDNHCSKASARCQLGFPMPTVP